MKRRRRLPRARLLATLVLGSVALAQAPADRAQEEALPAAAVALEQAVRAHGGEGGLEAWDNAVIEGRAVMHFGPNEFEGERTIYVRDGTMLRVDTVVEFGGARREFIGATTGKSAWRRFRARVYDFPPDNFRNWLRHRPTLLLEARRDPSSVRVVGRLEHEGTPLLLLELPGALGPVRIGLDPETHLVRIIEFHAEENAGEGRTEKVFRKHVYDDYRPVDEIPFPHRLREYADGVLETDLTVTRVRLGQPPELSRFARPEDDDEARDWSDQLAD